jgi:hypothetical protein
MKKTNHAEVRCQQRGISNCQVDLILLHGKKSRRPGGAWEYRLRRKDKNKIISELKRQINIVEKCAGKAVIIGSDQDTILTTYHLTRR